MVRFCALLFSVLGVHAHLTVVCTSTAPSSCQDSSLVFWLGTYHPSGSPSGNVVIVDIVESPGNLMVSKI